MLLNIFQAQKQLDALKADNENLIKQLADKENAAIQASDLVHNLSEAQKAFDEKVSTLQKEHGDIVATLKTDFETKLAELNTQLEEAKQSAGKEAAQIVASMGVETGTVKETLSAAVTPQQAFDKFKSLTGAERSEYYKQNRALIVQASRS